MGNSCSPSNLDSYASNLFDVYNVDARLFKHSKGRIQITNNGLLLHYENSHGQQGPILWPLNGIRRYGFHKNIFLFECGRKCASGEGLFAFKCSKAKRLNDAIHKAIVNSATQVYNLQENLSVTKKYAKTNNVADLNSTVVTNLLSSNDADSLNYTSLNEFNQATSKSINFLQSTVANTGETPYYVNNSLVRLPLNLTFMDSTTSNNEYNNYVNNTQVDPSILHITNKFNSQNRNKKISNNKLSFTDTGSLNYATARYKGHVETATPIATSERQEENLLNYINPSILRSSDNQRKSEDDQSKDKSKESDYVCIDLNKTPAAQFSKKQVENKRMEYFMLNKLKK